MNKLLEPTKVLELHYREGVYYVSLPGDQDGEYVPHADYLALQTQFREYVASLKRSGEDLVECCQRGGSQEAERFVYRLAENPEDCGLAAKPSPTYKTDPRLRENPPEGWLECPTCDCYHPPDYTGDCRNDAARWPSIVTAGS